MNNVIIRFREIFNQLLCNSNGLLDPPDIKFRQYHQSLIVDIDHAYPEIFYNFEKADGSGYLLFFNERNSHSLLYDCLNETIASLALISVFMRNCVPSLMRTSDARLRVKQEIDLGNTEAAQKIVIETVGNESVSFNKSEYSKISLIQIDDKKMDVFFHDHTILFCSYFNKPDIQQGYHMALVYGYYLFVFRKLMSIVQPKIDFSEFEYLYLTGFNEKKCGLDST